MEVHVVVTYRRSTLDSISLDAALGRPKDVPGLVVVGSHRLSTVSSTALPIGPIEPARSSRPKPNGQPEGWGSLRLPVRFGSAAPGWSGRALGGRRF